MGEWKQHNELYEKCKQPNMTGQVCLLAKIITFFQSQVHGLTGLVKFDNRGLRKNIAVDVIELTSSGIIKVGTWNTSEGLNITRSYESTSVIDDGSLRNKSFIVLLTLVNFRINHKNCKIL